MEKPIVINMLSSADKVSGQGVGSAFEEQVQLLNEGANDLFEVRINSIKEADIIHSHTIEPQNFVRMISNNKPNVCYVHFLPDTLNGSIQLPKPIFNIFKAYVIGFYKSADYLVVVNPDFMKELEKYDIPKEKMVYIPNYVSKDSFYKKSNDEIKTIRKQYGIDENAFVVIGVGQVQTRKGVMDFVEVAKKLEHIQFVWCGGFSFGKITDGYNELKELVDHPPKNVKFLGIVPREKMNDMYNMADVLFMPSYNELFPMSILEAVNLEIPIVLRDLELYETILFDHYLKGKNNDQFVKHIDELAKNKQLYQSQCNHSKVISNYYSKENVLKIWKEFYTKIYKEWQSGELMAKRKMKKK